ncbi:NUDIX domain-containing protein [Roseivirga sp. BDSF3-8]|uniref:NUDIX hydrolase n=1 Tax=Roseivirga sp. BDSF3-8 TaxID=3241598 RepID=UPI00353216E8
MTQPNYSEEARMLVAVDCTIFGFDEEELKLLLVKRSFEPEKDKWSLMGGFLRDQETSDEAAERVLHDLTGLQQVFMEQVHTFTKPERDPGERTVSIAYYALINIKDHDTELSEQHDAQWFSLKDLPPLIFDHSQMVHKAILKLRQKTSTQPVGRELLPQKFTMRQLQRLYEAIYDEEFDKRNFTKRITLTNILKKLDEKDMSSSRKGAYLYEFDLEKDGHAHSYSFNV